MRGAALRESETRVRRGVGTKRLFWHGKEKSLQSSSPLTRGMPRNWGLITKILYVICDLTFRLICAAPFLAERRRFSLGGEPHMVQGSSLRAWVVQPNLVQQNICCCPFVVGSRCVGKFEKSSDDNGFVVIRAHHQ